MQNLNLTSDLKPITKRDQTLDLEYFSNPASATLNAYNAQRQMLLDAFVEIDDASKRPVLYLRFNKDLEGNPSAAYWLDSGEIKS